MEKLKNLLNLNEQIQNIDNEQFELLIDNLNDIVDKHEFAMRDVIVDSIQRNAKHDDDAVIAVNEKSKLMRILGNKFLNLFRISFTVEFAGVMLINFTIPKLNSNGKTKIK